MAEENTKQEPITEPVVEPKQEPVVEPKQEPKPEPSAFKKERERGKNQLAKELGFENPEELKGIFGDLKEMANDFSKIKQENEQIKAEKAREEELKGLRNDGFDEAYLEDAQLILNNTPEDKRQAKKEELLLRFGSNLNTTNSSQGFAVSNSTSNSISGSNDLISALEKWRKGEI